MDKNIYGLIPMVVSAVSLVLNIVGLAIPYWLYISNGTVSNKMGLWQFCLGTNCDEVPEQEVTDALEATRAMELLGMVLLIGALACAFLKLFVLKDQVLLQKVAGACAAVAGICMIIGCIVFAAKFKEDIDMNDVFDLHAGFALCIVAGVGSIVAAVLFFIMKND